MRVATIRLPDLAAKLLAARGDDRPVRGVRPPLPALAAGALLAPDRATVLGPDIDTWLRAQATDGAGARTATEVRRKQAAARDVSPV